MSITPATGAKNKQKLPSFDAFFYKLRNFINIFPRSGGNALPFGTGEPANGKGLRDALFGPLLYGGATRRLSSPRIRFCPTPSASTLPAVLEVGLLGRGAVEGDSCGAVQSATRLSRVDLFFGGRYPGLRPGSSRSVNYTGGLKRRSASVALHGQPSRRGSLGSTF